jgi:hypothetical protein
MPVKGAQTLGGQPPEASSHDRRGIEGEFTGQAVDPRQCVGNHDAIVGCNSESTIRRDGTPKDVAIRRRPDTHLPDGR